MQILNNTPHLEPFLTSLQEDPRQKILFLDYDGTLAPFTVQRDQAVPYPGVREVLTRIQKGGKTRLVLVSGRSLRDLPGLLKLEQTPELWGSHGLERLTSTGEYSSEELTASAKLGITQAAEVVEARGLHDHLEPKPLGIALHFRGASAEQIELLEAAVQLWQGIAGEAGFDLHRFDGGAELRVPGRNKGYAVRFVLDEVADPGPVAYLGDDLTDEDAFGALGSRGLSVLVRERPRQTCAQVWLQSPSELLEFLELWV